MIPPSRAGMARHLQMEGRAVAAKSLRRHRREVIVMESMSWS